jgi:hypothetical protein
MGSATGCKAIKVRANVSKHAHPAQAPVLHLANASLQYVWCAKLPWVAWLCHGFQWQCHTSDRNPQVPKLRRLWYRTAQIR